ncbi:MAG TPA: hypothetical protein VJN43_06995 [Bryobacteraceae bacterium]|nr:hypothetical protein [Bryobacteraceae bacterium]
MSRAAAVIVLVHLLITVVHGWAHAQLHIDLSIAANIFVLVVIGIGPLAGLVLLWSQRWRAGAAIVAFTMAASLLFGVWNHFVVESADHVAHLPPGDARLPFQMTAWLLAVAEAAGALVGFAMLRPGPVTTRQRVSPPSA